MNPTRTQALVAVVAVAVVALLGVGAATGALFSILPADAPGSPTTGDAAERPAEPSTAETVGYVEGYWFDDELPADAGDGAALEEEELEAVVYRSMARVEVIRDRTFEEPVDVDVISRETFQEEGDDLFVNLSDEQRLRQNVTFEALFAADRDTDAEAEVEALFGDAVVGYYDPETDEIVLVSEDPTAPETDEVILGHELLHALQDQHFGLGRYERETIDRDTATNGLLEGDAVWVDTEYERRCVEEWECIEPGAESGGFEAVNWGLYLIVFQPYDDGPTYVETLREEGGWSAVDDAYEDPPASSSEVIRPGESRDPVEIDVADRSSDDWHPFEVDGAPDRETVGEVGMVSMFAAGAMDPDRPAVIDRESFLTDEPGYDYDQPYTDGWAGDELVVYVHDDVDGADDPAEAVEHTAYVWESAWETGEDARQFVEGYRQLLEGYGAEPVADRPDTYVIDERFPGAYAVDRDDDRVRIVRAPSVADLEEVHADVATSGGDTIGAAPDGAPAEAASGTADSDAIGGPVDSSAVSAGIAAVVVVGTGMAIVLARGRRPAPGVEAPTNASADDGDDRRGDDSSGDPGGVSQGDESPGTRR